MVTVAQTEPIQSKEPGIYFPGHRQEAGLEVELRLELVSIWAASTTGKGLACYVTVLALERFLQNQHVNAEGSRDSSSLHQGL